MTIIDAGPLVALIDPSDIDHLRCLNAAAQLVDSRMVTTWPCLTEAMYLVGRRKGHVLQDAVWRMYRDGVLDIHHTSPDEADRMQALMTMFRDTPMDLADASIVAEYVCFYD